MRLPEWAAVRREDMGAVLLKYVISTRVTVRARGRPRRRTYSTTSAAVSAAAERGDAQADGRVGGFIPARQTRLAQRRKDVASSSKCSRRLSRCLRP